MTEKQIAAYLRILRRNPAVPQTTRDRYPWPTRFEALYRLRHDGRHRPAEDGVPAG
jgi:hypothetical protein